MRYIDTVRKCEWYAPAEWDGNLPARVQAAPDSHHFLYFQNIRDEFDIWMDEQARDEGYKTIERMVSNFGSANHKADAVRAHIFRDACRAVMRAAKIAYRDNGTETTLAAIIAACPDL